MFVTCSVLSNLYAFEHFELEVRCIAMRCDSGHKPLSAGGTARCCGSGDMSYPMEEGKWGEVKMEYHCFFLMIFFMS